MATDDEIRAKLREAFCTFSLPRTLPTGRQNNHEVILLDGGRGHACSVCWVMIPITAEGSWALTYPGGRVFFMHGHCRQLWEEERFSPPTRPN